jgi:hypothetical protein
VETERRLAALDDLVDDYRDHMAGLPSTGGGAAKRNAVFAHVHDSLDDSGPVVDDARLRAMLKHSARTLYPGVLNDCFFERDGALCLRSFGEGANEPLLPLCQPNRCGNSVITNSHVTSWNHAIGEVRVHLRQKDLSQNQRHALKAKLSEMEAAIAPLDQQ